MVVVTIVGVLATLGLVILGKHNKNARTYETLAMMQSIRIAQERWRSENLVYLNVSGGDDPQDISGVNGPWFPRDPRTAYGDVRVSFLQAAASHQNGAKWIMLNPTSNPLVYGGYKTNAGLANQNMTPAAIAIADWPGWPAPGPPGAPAEAWYVIQAITDTDMDGTVGFYMASSLNGEVYRQDEGE
jgi:hypothetical protein